MNSILFGIFFVSFLLLLAGFIFLAFYKRLPSARANIREVSVTEKASGNALIVTVWIRYDVNGAGRYKTVVLSSYASRRDQLRAEAERIQEFYRDKQAKYYHLPGLIGVGVLEGSITRGYLWACALLTVIFGVLSGVTLLGLK